MSAWGDDVTLRVEVGFGSGPLVAAPSWTDITTSTRAVRIKRGRLSVQRPFTAGTVKVLVDNRDAEFDPNNAGATHFGDMNIGTPIRIRATHDATTYDVFYGHISRWPLNYQMPSEATVTLEGIENLGILRSSNVDATYTAETAASRLANILLDAGWPGGAFNDLTGTTPVAGIAYNGSAGRLIDKTVEAEQGLFFIANDGAATFYDRIKYSSATAAASFGGAGLGYDGAPRVIYDDDLLINKAVVTGATGSAQTVLNAASITAHGESAPNPITNTTIDGVEQAIGVATWIVGKYKDVKSRIVGLRIDPPKDEANLWPEVLARDLADVVNVEFSPPGGGTDLDQLVRVEGITHDIRAGLWTVDYTCHPLSTFETTDYWILGTSDDLDTNTVLA